MQRGRRTWGWDDYVAHISVAAGIDPLTADACTLEQIELWANESQRQKASDKAEWLVMMQLAAAGPHSREAVRGAERLCKQFRKAAH